MRIKHIFLVILIVSFATTVFAAKPVLVCDADGDNHDRISKKCPEGDDCDDSNPNVYPGALELCDGIDNNCDGTIDEGCPEPPPEPTRCDQDADGHDSASRSCKGDDCDDNNPNVYPGAEEICDGVDNNCDGTVDEGCSVCTDADDDGVTTCDGDCDDSNPDVYPGAVELCDGKDNNCDGTVDEGCSSMYPNSMAAAGDSITVAYNADGTESLFFGSTGYQYEVSWALGDSIRVNSHAQRLETLNPGFSWDADFDNHAISGSNIIDLKGQVIQIVQDGPYDYVVIFIGHNDICDASIPEEMLSKEDFRVRFLDAMEYLYDQDQDGLRDANPPDVVVSSLARVSNLYNVGKDDGWCTMIWSLGSVCRVVTSGNAQNIAAADLRTQEYNEVLQTNATEYGYTYVPQIYETQFTLDDLSDYDCFHPNVSGQNRISEIIWSNGIYGQ